MGITPHTALTHRARRRLTLRRTGDVARVAPQDISKDAVGALLGRIGRLPEAVDGVDLVELHVVVGEEAAVQDDQPLAQN